MKNSLLFAQEQARLHHRKSVFWGITTVIFFIWLIWLISSACMIQGCSDDDGDKKNSAADVEHCKDTVGAIEECFGAQEVFGMSAAEATKECDSGERFDSYDRCFFDCEDKAMDCDDFGTCLDGC
jgi:hypothetical protein